MVRDFLRIAVVIFWSALALAQTAPPSNSSPSSPQAGRQEPCWKQAGIGQSVMEQHQQIEHDAHSQMVSVCEDTSLTPGQKQEKVREIRQQREEKINALLTPEQQSTLHACQQQRHGGNMAHHAGAGPCGNMGAHGRQAPENGDAGGNPQPPQSE